MAGRSTAESLSSDNTIDSKATPGEFSLPQLTTTDIGIATIDDGFRYRAVNHVLACTNGLPAEAHIGKTVRQILGPAADEFEPRLRQAFGTGKSLIFEAAARLPRKLTTGHWILSYIPIKDASNKVSMVCAVVVELTERKKFENSLFSLMGKLSYLKASLLMKRRQRRAKKSQHPQPLELLEQCMAEAIEVLRMVRPSALPIATQPVDSFSQAKSSGTPFSLSGLSRRESQVLQLLASNKNNKEVAVNLGISVRTVEAHRRRIMEKLGLHSMGELIHLAIRYGLVEA